MRTGIVLLGAQLSDIAVGLQHRSASIGRDVMQDGFGRRETSAATLSESQLVTDRPPVH
jgi:hypothetical protein